VSDAEQFELLPEAWQEWVLSGKDHYGDGYWRYWIEDCGCVLFNGAEEEGGVLLRQPSSRVAVALAIEEHQAAQGEGVSRERMRRVLGKRVAGILQDALAKARRHGEDYDPEWSLRLREIVLSVVEDEEEHAIEEAASMARHRSAREAAE
jgi:hypothetical protein